MPLVAMIGRQFGRLVVKERSGTDKNGQAIWLCHCQCGGFKAALGGNLRRGFTTSCGCLQDESRRDPSRRHKKHGAHLTPTYKAWGAMHDRCRRPRVSSWLWYGGRGISVCERWQRFENFLADMGERPSPDHSLDRINNDGNYEPGNCRWATRTEQQNNRRCNHRLTVNGVTMTIQQWSDATGIRDVTIHQRLKRGWSAEEAVSVPALAFGRTLKTRSTPSRAGIER